MMGGSENEDENKQKISSETTTMAISLKLAPFWVNNPVAWFVQTEAQFSISKIKKDHIKYYHVLAALPQNVIESVIDIIEKPPQQNLYENLKEALTKRHSLSEEKRIEKLLSSEELGDRRPSDFYRYLVQLAGSSDTISVSLIKKLWLRRLPQAINIALISCSEKDISDLITLADKIWEALPSSSIMATNSPSSSKSEYLHNQKLEREIEELRLEINKLSNFRSRAQSRSRSRRYQGHRPVSKKRTQNKICWYHSRFGQSSRKCNQPCEFKQVSTSTKPNAKN